jgi:predicted choloylglycine hydrolase
MKRRYFLKSIGMSSIALTSILHCKRADNEVFVHPSEKRFAHLEITGSYRDIGFQIGKVFKKNIITIIDLRKTWHNDLIETLRSNKGRQLSSELLRLSRKHFPQVVEEIQGIADGSGLHFDSIWAMCIKSELGTVKKEPPGCSSIFYNDSKNMWLSHNEDGDTAYKDIMFTIKVTPPSGITYMSMVYPGIITGNGPSLNSRGIVQTTNYINSTKSEVGIPRYVIGRAILEANNLEEAIQIASFTPRAYPYHHHLCSLTENKYASVETIPENATVRYPDGIYYHTNHLLFEENKNYIHQDPDYMNSSSVSRFSVIKDKIEQFKVDNMHPDSLLSILSSHESKPYSPCRHPVGEVSGQTLGTAFIDINKGKFLLYKGNPCTAVGSNHFISFEL